jgi:hypothetical protein
LIFRNVEFVNAFDHGREIQIGISDGRGECYNPTEAGSVNDGIGMGTTSKLLGVNTQDNILHTTVSLIRFSTNNLKGYPAFWLAPGQVRYCSGTYSNVIRQIPALVQDAQWE